MRTLNIRVGDGDDEGGVGEGGALRVGAGDGKRGDGAMESKGGEAMVSSVTMTLTARAEDTSACC